ncbi:MAG TPA: glycogen debranching N-terminal domain-containing protein, partial [Gemmata sp.]|nr:glycogen debranching N-terminal domain-containing protein [Gemmata sp.]
MSDNAGNDAVHEHVPAGQASELAHDDPYYIVAPAPMAGERDRVLKQGDTFAVYDHHGDIRPAGMKEQGLFHEGTRFLSCLVLRLGGGEPMFLSSTVKEDNALFAIDLTNPDIRVADQIAVPRGTLHVFRGMLLWRGVGYQIVRVRNYGAARIEVPFALRFEADFADIFEVRGQTRQHRGHIQRPIVANSSVVLAYEGLDGVIRRTRLEFDPPPARLSGTEARFGVALDPHQEATFHLTVACETGNGAAPKPLDYATALENTSNSMRDAKAQACDIYTSNEQFNDWLNRSIADLMMMLTHTPHGLYPYAGVPWFSTPFGRDGIITALQSLWLEPDIARGVLSYLAANQADATIPEQDAEPGKILHEARLGEMAALREIPFAKYYGSVDSTPLFVLLAGAYFERTGDREFAERLWPHVERALEWIDRYGDRDDDGFVEYFRATPEGLAQQGWKDSSDSIFHADGTLAQGPIALCEVQGYVYAAKRGAAKLAVALDRIDAADELGRQAAVLRKRFEESF